MGRGSWSVGGGDKVLGGAGELREAGVFEKGGSFHLAPPILGGNP